MSRAGRCRPVSPSCTRLGSWRSGTSMSLAAVYGFLMMISLAGGPSLVPSLIADEQLATANALEMLSFTLGGVIGPPLAGAADSAIGAPNVVIVDVLSYFLFALALSRVRLAPRQVRRHRRRSTRITSGTRCGSCSATGFCSQPRRCSSASMSAAGMLARLVADSRRSLAWRRRGAVGALLGMLAVGEVRVRSSPVA